MPSAAYENLRVYKSAMDMTSYFELVVRHFSRYHKYTLGSELRQLSYAVLVFIVKANTKTHRVTMLQEALDRLLELKLRVQVCAEIKAFNSANSPAVALQKVIEVSKQCEGWIMSCQNPGSRRASRERASMEPLGTPVAGSTGIRMQGTVPLGSVPQVGGTSKVPG